MNVQEEIFRSIETLSKVGTTAVSADTPTVILGIEGDGKYKVRINGVDRIAKDGIGFHNLVVGTSVWVHAMNGDVNNLYIMCRR